MADGRHLENRYDASYTADCPIQMKFGKLIHNKMLMSDDCKK